MDIATSVFIIIAGVAYLVYQYHVENPGSISSTIKLLVIFLSIVWAPCHFWIWIANNANYSIGIIGAFCHLGLLIGGGIYLMTNSDKMARDAAKESVAIWAEVDKLTPPDQETLLQIRRELNLPVYPVDNEAHNRAAYQQWRIREYNKRLKEKHWVTF